MGPCILVSCPPKSGETHVIREGVAGPVLRSHLFCIDHSPSIRPVWWILSSALLSWVIWGIIPKVSHPNSSVHFFFLRARLFSSHSLDRTAAPIANVSLFFFLHYLLEDFLFLRLFFLICRTSISYITPQPLSVPKKKNTNSHCSTETVRLRATDT